MELHNKEQIQFSTPIISSSSVASNTYFESFLPNNSFFLKKFVIGFVHSK